MSYFSARAGSNTSMLPAALQLDTIRPPVYPDIRKRIAARHTSGYPNKFQSQYFYRTMSLSHFRLPELPSFRLVIFIIVIIIQGVHEILYFFPKILKYSGLLPFYVFPQCQCVCTLPGRWKSGAAAELSSGKL